jgi:nucleoside-diphosphate-sugar epimerase
MILLAGGTGVLGTEVARLLEARGESLRVLTRDPARAAHLSATAEVVRGDPAGPCHPARRAGWGADGGARGRWFCPRRRW